jgi:hypothetical protein
LSAATALTTTPAATTGSRTRSHLAIRYRSNRVHQAKKSSLTFKHIYYEAPPQSGVFYFCESPLMAYSVEKLQNFLGSKFICDVTISKN